MSCANFRKCLVIAAAIAGLMPLNSAFAQDARQLLKAMSDYIAAQQTFSFTYQSTIEVVTHDFEKLQFVSSGTATVSRPDKIRVTRRGGFVDLELVFDGSMLSVYGKNLNAYAQVEGKGTLEDLSGRLSDAGIDPPGADLFTANAFDELMDGVTEADHFASAFVNGVECEYLTFRKRDIDWQIWIEAGERPIPRRYVITSKQIAQAPQYTLEISDFKSGSAVASPSFDFEKPATAKKVDMSELDHLDELPAPKDEGDVQ
jgi:hypothetical protein